MISCVITLLSHPGIDINLKNNRGQSAIMVALYKSLIVFNRVAKTCTAFPVDSYGKVVLCGSSGAGKSTMTQVKWAKHGSIILVKFSSSIAMFSHTQLTSIAMVDHTQLTSIAMVTNIAMVSHTLQLTSIAMVSHAQLTMQGWGYLYEMLVITIGPCVQLMTHVEIFSIFRGNGDWYLINSYGHRHYHVNKSWFFPHE